MFLKLKDMRKCTEMPTCLKTTWRKSSFQSDAICNLVPDHLKRQCKEIFYFRFFHELSSSEPSVYLDTTISNYFHNSWRNTHSPRCTSLVQNEKKVQTEWLFILCLDTCGSQFTLIYRFFCVQLRCSHSVTVVFVDHGCRSLIQVAISAGVTAMNEYHGKDVTTSVVDTGDIYLPPIPVVTEYIFYCKRAILFLSSSRILTPHPPLRPPLLRVEDRLAGRRGDGGSIFWKTREIGLPSYSKICSLCR